MDITLEIDSLIQEDLDEQAQEIVSQIQTEVEEDGEETN
jgi:hypothetical protein